MFIKFNDINSVNIKEIDNQHRGIIEIINNFLETRKDNNKEKLLAIIEDLRKYSKDHLDYEEGLLEKYGYDGIEEHKKQHQFYREKVTEFENKCRQGDGEHSQEIHSFLAKWWINHINNTDHKYSDFLNKKGVF